MLLLSAEPHSLIYRTGHSDSGATMIRKSGFWLEWASQAMLLDTWTLMLCHVLSFIITHWRPGSLKIAEDQAPPNLGIQGTRHRKRYNAFFFSIKHGPGDTHWYDGYATVKCCMWSHRSCLINLGAPDSIRGLSYCLFYASFRREEKWSNDSSKYGVFTFGYQ